MLTTMTTTTTTNTGPLLSAAAVRCERALPTRGFEPQVACLLEVERPVAVGVEALEDCLVLVAGYLADECHLHLFEAEHAVLVRVLRRRDMVLIRGYC